MAAADTLDGILAALPTGAPAWQHAGAAAARPDPDAAARALLDMEEVDRNLCVLVYGPGLDLGSVSYALRLDPAVTAWHLERLLTASGRTPAERAAFEASLAALLRDDHDGLPPPPDGAASWRARDLIAAWPRTTRDRLQARLVRDEHDLLQRRARSGLGVGVLFLVGAVFLFFLVYGAVLDQNPMWKGRDLLRRGQADKARDAFALLGELPEARRWMAIAWLADGGFREGIRLIRRPETGWPNHFQPLEPPFPDVEVDHTSRALVPRGLEMDPRPEFRFLAGEAGSLELYSHTTGRALRTPLSDLPPVGELVTMAYPEEWPSLPAGLADWSVPGPPGEPRQSATIELLPVDERRNINGELTRHVQELPPAARLFMRGHYFLRYGLYVRASHQFAALARQFPGQDHPRRMLDGIGQALGVDGETFLR